MPNPHNVSSTKSKEVIIMKSENTAIKSELSRVRELKRNAEATIELLRSDSEAGKIHIRVNENKEFRQKVAEAVVKEADPGCYALGYYADPVEGTVYFKEINAAWGPWLDSVSWRIVDVSSLINEDGNDFDPSVDWDIVDWPYREMAIAYLESEKEELEENGDIPAWVTKSDIVEFARNHSESWEELIESIENQAQEEAVSFALIEILDEIVIEVG